MCGHSSARLNTPTSANPLLYLLPAAAAWLHVVLIRRHAESTHGKMKLLHVTALAVAFLIAGCASPDVNPRTAKPGIGYVDFYADDTSGLCWEIRQIETNDQVHGKILLQEFKRRTNDTIRLAVTPGSHRLQISFLNRVVMKPGIANV